MTRIVMIGGGAVGLTTALLLGRDGHDVTVLERDPALPPPPDTAWGTWERRGVNQFRLLHYILPGYRARMDANAPDVVQALRDAGAASINPLRDAPDFVTGGFRDGDERYEAVTARRPVVEAVLAGVVAGCANVTVHRGVAVVGLLTGEPARDGVPHVVGVRTDGGDDVFADLVVDCSGRRSSLSTMLTDIGARAPAEEVDDCGFVYYGRHFTSGDGSLPPAIGPLLITEGSLSSLTLPADNGTWGVGLVASARDTAMRALKDVDTWTKVVTSYPMIAHWVDGQPLDDTVNVMAKIEDRIRTFVVDGVPVATGVAALADSWACTNPSVGRGITIGTMHGLALRDLLRAAPSDPVEFATAWHEATMATVEPWYRTTLAFDRGRLDEVDAEIDGREFVPSPEYEITKALANGTGKDPELLRAFMEVASVFRTGPEVLSDPALFEKVITLGAGWRDERLPGPSRDELLALVGA